MKRLSFYIGVVFFIGILTIQCSQQSEPSIDSEKIREYANALYNRELYSQAIKEYQRS